MKPSESYSRAPARVEWTVNSPPGAALDGRGCGRSWRTRGRILAAAVLLLACAFACWELGKSGWVTVVVLGDSQAVRLERGLAELFGELGGDYVVVQGVAKGGTRASYWASSEGRDRIRSKIVEAGNTDVDVVLLMMGWWDMLAATYYRLDAEAAVDKLRDDVAAVARFINELARQENPVNPEVQIVFVGYPLLPDDSGRRWHEIFEKLATVGTNEGPGDADYVKNFHLYNAQGVLQRHFGLPADPQKHLPRICAGGPRDTYPHLDRPGPKAAYDPGPGLRGLHINREGSLVLARAVYRDVLHPMLGGPPLPEENAHGKGEVDRDSSCKDKDVSGS